MGRKDILDVFTLAEATHRRFLEVLQAELDILGVRDLNNVRALLVLSLQDQEMSAGELIWRGCYVGSNVSYNLKKLTEAGYVEQCRSSHDRRVTMVRNSAKGLELCDALGRRMDTRIATLAGSGLDVSAIQSCGRALRAMHQMLEREVQSVASAAAFGSI